jgi:uncharacterized protein YjiS (DUF1127 family)
MIREYLDSLPRPFPLARSHAAWPSIGRVLLRSAQQVIAWFESRRRLRRAECELMALDDRTLADIGLRRADVYYALRRPPIEQREGGRQR